VTDTTGAVVPGASVAVTGQDTGLTRSTSTNSDGLYTFADLPVGSYKIDVELSGFKTGTVKDITLNVADSRDVNVALAPGEITETVSVVAEAIQVRTSGGEVAGLVTGEQVRELPLNGRNFLQLTLLQPGVTAPDFLNTKDKGLLGGSDVSVSGNDVTANMWTVDGANNNDVGSNRTILIYPSVDAIEEFKIHRNSYGAEFGGASGAQINIVTRGGTNEFHGSAFYFGRRDALNSKNYFLEQAGKDKEKLDRNDFGWTFGGPIIKDKLHFFASQEWNKETRGVVRTAFVPTAAERAGDFSAPRIAGCSQAAPIDPLTGQPFPGNRIPADRLSPGGLAYLQLYPLPNTTPGAGSCNNWVASLDTPLDWRQENIRLDWSLSSATRVMLRYTQDHWTNNSPSAPALWGDDPFPAVSSNWEQPGRSVVAQLNQNIGSNGINSLTFSYSSNKISVSNGGTDPELNSRITGLIQPLFSPKGITPGSTEVSHPVFWGGAGYDALWSQGAFENSQDLFVLKDDYSAVFGKHFLKVGALASWNRKNEDTLGNASDRHSRFWGSAGLNGWGANTGNILADFLLRDMTFGFSESSTNRQNPQRWRDLEFYVSDSWKVSPRVTLDYGVRYSRYFNPYADDDRFASFQPDLFNPALGSDACNGLLLPPGSNACSALGLRGGTFASNRSLAAEDKNNFAPRLGVAWDVSGNGKTAIRAGLGQFYLRERVSPGLNLAGNPPFSVVQSGIRKLDTTAEPCAGCFGLSTGRPTAGREAKAVTPNTWQWNLTVQRELARNTTLELSYVGNKGTNLLRSINVNQVAAGDSNGNGVDDRLEYARSQPANGSLRPFGVFGDGNITYWDHGGNSIYHSLQSQFRSQFGRGSQFQASYTWSRTIANIPLDNSSGGLARDVAPLDNAEQGLERGLARTHRAHLFNTSLVLMLPAFTDKSGFVKNVLGDWELGLIAIATSGTPVTIYSGGLPGLNGGPSGTGYTDNQRPNRVPGQPCRATGGPREQIFNPAAWTLAGFQLGSNGDSGRGVCNGPGFFQVDLALFKNIQLNDRVRLQLRFEVFNVFNRVNFLSPGVDSGAPYNSLNASSVTLDAPLAQATRITAFTPAGNFGQATATRDPRQAQFGIKLIF
jgi:hypothetical protein